MIFSSGEFSLSYVGLGVATLATRLSIHSYIDETISQPPEELDTTGDDTDTERRGSRTGTDRSRDGAFSHVPLSLALLDTLGALAGVDTRLELGVDLLGDLGAVLDGHGLTAVVLPLVHDLGYERGGEMDVSRSPTAVREKWNLRADGEISERRGPEKGADCGLELPA